MFINPRGGLEPGAAERAAIVPNCEPDILGSRNREWPHLEGRFFSQGFESSSWPLSAANRSSGEPPSLQTTTDIYRALPVYQALNRHQQRSFLVELEKMGQLVKLVI